MFGAEGPKQSHSEYAYLLLTLIYQDPCHRLGGLDAGSHEYYRLSISTVAIYG